MKKYTKKEKAKLKEMAKVFRQAKEILWNGQGILEGEQMICYAIGTATAHDFSEVPIKCRQLVMNAISPCMRMDTWFYREHGHWPSPREAQEVRHTFLDNLIKECEEASR